jgi:hypothetical protein
VHVDAVHCPHIHDVDRICSCTQERYAAGVKDILQATFDGGDLKPADIICKDGKLAPQVRSRLGDLASLQQHECRCMGQGRSLLSMCQLQALKLASSADVTATWSVVGMSLLDVRAVI